MSSGLTKIFLHLGYEKTGTTATQNLLTVANPHLAEMGVFYPVRRNIEDALKGKGTSGNIRAKEPVAPQLLKAVRENPGYSTYIFSSEIVFWEIADQIPVVHNQISPEYDLSVVISVREPLEMLQSYYGQEIKRNGYFGEIEGFVDGKQHLIHASDIVAVCSDLGITVKLFNYSVAKRDISKCLLEYFGIPQALVDHWEKQIPAIMNRSLTYEERNLIKSANKVLGKEYGRRLSDALVVGFSEIASEPPEIPKTISEKVVQKNIDAAAFINQYLSPKNQISLQTIKRAGDLEHTRFTTAQWDAVFETLAEDIEHLRQSRLEIERVQHENVQLQKEARSLKKKIEHLGSKVNELKSEKLKIFRKNNQLQAERDHAYRYPWKYLRSALKQRFPSDK
ncbi:hypothetical protein NBRC116589_27570 [Ruegeria sp. HU-ET01832]|uniref:hypothetical protein n=1 Tax=Ruegeria sp. HU-ET01832 TaxID=3135906 RepID=UPI0031066764